MTRVKVRRRRLVLGGLAASVTGFAVHAADGSAARKPATPERGWRLLVNEAFTGESNIFILVARYRPLADHVSSPAFATPVGLVAYGQRNHIVEATRTAGVGAFGRVAGRLRGLFREFF